MSLQKYLCGQGWQWGMINCALVLIQVIKELGGGVLWKSFQVPAEVVAVQHREDSECPRAL